jgi:transcription initiation factor TFIIIB Brf1 subunit/transcription initiation factor TFIIB
MLQAREQDLTPSVGQGNTVGVQVAGVLYYVVRQQKLPLLLSDITSTADSPAPQVARVYRYAAKPLSP